MTEEDLLKSEAKNLIELRLKKEIELLKKVVEERTVVPAKGWKRFFEFFRKLKEFIIFLGALLLAWKGVYEPINNWVKASNQTQKILFDQNFVKVLQQYQATTDPANQESLFYILISYDYHSVIPLFINEIKNLQNNEQDSEKKRNFVKKAIEAKIDQETMLGNINNVKDIISLVEADFKNYYLKSLSHFHLQYDDFKNDRICLVDYIWLLENTDLKNDQHISEDLKALCDSISHFSDSKAADRNFLINSQLIPQWCTPVSK